MGLVITMGYYDSLYWSTYRAVEKANMHRYNPAVIGQRAASVAVYDARQRDIRSFGQSGGGRLGDVYRAYLAGRTPTENRPREKAVDQTVGESIGSIYKAAGVNVDVNKYREAGVDGWLTQNISTMTPKQRRKIAAAMTVLHAGGQVTSGGKVLKGSEAARLIQAYGEIPSDAKIPAGVTPYMTITGDDIGFDFYQGGQPMDRQRFDKYMGANVSSKYKGQYKVGERQMTDKISSGEKYDVVRYQQRVDTGSGVKTEYKAVAVPHHQTVKYQTPDGMVHTKKVPQMDSGEMAAFKTNMIKDGNRIVSIGDATSLGESQLRSIVAKGDTGKLYSDLVVTQGLEKGREVPQLVTDYKVLVDKTGMSKEEAKSIVSRQVKQYKAEAAAFGVTLTKGDQKTTTKVFGDGTKVVQGGINVPSLDTAAKQAYSDMGYTVQGTGGTIINFKSGSVGLQGVTLSPEAQAHYAKLGVSVQNVSADGQTTAGHGVRRKSTSRVGGRGKSRLGSSWGHAQNKALDQARAFVDAENKWHAEQELRAKEWDEYYAWVAEQEKLYEAQKKAEEKAEKEYQEALAKYKKEQNKEGIEAWATATPYRRDRVQKPRRRPKQNIIQDAAASINWGRLANPFEAAGGMLSPYQRQSRKRVITKAIRQGAMQRQVQPFRMGVMGDKPLAKRIRKGPKAAKRITRVDYFSPAFAIAGFYMPQQGKKGGKQ